MKKMFSFVMVIVMMCTIFNIVAFADDVCVSVQNAQNLQAVREHNLNCRNYFHTDKEKQEAENRELYPKLQPIGLDVVYAENLLSIDDINNFLKSGYASEIGDVIEYCTGTGQLEKELKKNFEESQNPLLVYVWDIISMFDSVKDKMYSTNKRCYSQYVMFDSTVLDEWFEVYPEYQKRVEDFFEVSGISRMVTYLYAQHDFPNYLRGYTIYNGVVFCDIELVSFTKLGEWYAKEHNLWIFDEKTGELVPDVDKVTSKELKDVIQQYNHECWIPEIR